MDHVKGLENVVENSKNLAKAQPKEMKAFRAFDGEVYKDGALTVKEKELVTLGIAISVRCEGCIEVHVKSLVNLKATREEIAEVISVAVAMGGGPSSVYGAKALEAFDQLSK